MRLQEIINSSFSQTQFCRIDCSASSKPRLENGILRIDPALLQFAAETAFRETAFFYRQSHLKLLTDKLKDNKNCSNELSANERIVINMLLKNAISASKAELCLCQDTGTAVIYGWKNENIILGNDERTALEAGVSAACKKNNLRASLISASSMFEEKNTGNNLPAQIHIESNGIDEGNPRCLLLFTAKGGGSSNKTALFSMTKSLLDEKAFNSFLEEKITAIGTAACPPYRLSVVVGGTSPEQNLEIQKLASTEILDTAPYFKDDTNGKSHIHRDRYWEEKCMEIGRKSGLGAQFGGTGLLLDVRVLRLPRHAATLPFSIGVSCAAHRCLLAFIDKDGLAIENLERDPAAFLNRQNITINSSAALRLCERSFKTICSTHKIDLDRPIAETLTKLRSFKEGDNLSLSGKLLVARDAAHLNWHELISAGKKLPDYLLKYPVYYAGPSETPPGKIIGSLGPTTAERMDPYADELMSRGASLITLAKGERSPEWKKTCQKYGGVYLGTVGGAAALLSEEHITASEIIDYQELGMEAVRLITVKDLPVFIITVYN